MNLPDLPSSPLQVPRIRTTEWQTVGKLVGRRWSIKEWWRRCGWDDSFERYDFSYGLGYVGVYADWTIPAGEEFHMIEFARVNTTWTAALSQDEFKTATRIRLLMWQRRFQYEVVSGS